VVLREEIKILEERNKLEDQLWHITRELSLRDKTPGEEILTEGIHTPDTPLKLDKASEPAGNLIPGAQVH
jgi:hypothetical protein